MHYTQLPELYAKYKNRGLEILAFPCNQFKSQEPKSHGEILEFVAKRGITFPLFAKVKVNGSMFSNAGVEPLYVFCKAKAPGTLVNAIKWNFTKIMCDHNGVPVKRFAPNAEPVSMESFIEQLLEAREKALGPFKPEPSDESKTAAGDESKTAGDESKATAAAAPEASAAGAGASAESAGDATTAEAAAPSDGEGSEDKRGGDDATAAANQQANASL